MTGKRWKGGFLAFFKLKMSLSIAMVLMTAIQVSFSYEDNFEFKGMEITHTTDGEYHELEISCEVDLYYEWCKFENNGKVSIIVGYKNNTTKIILLIIRVNTYRIFLYIVFQFCDLMWFNNRSISVCDDSELQCDGCKDFEGRATFPYLSDYKCAIRLMNATKRVILYFYGLNSKYKHG